MLSEHDLPVGLRGHLLAESDCGRRQLSSSRWGRRASAPPPFALPTRWDTARGTPPHARPRLFCSGAFALGVALACNQYSLPRQWPAPSGWHKLKGSFKRTTRCSRASRAEPSPLAGADHAAGGGGGDNDLCCFSRQGLFGVVAGSGPFIAPRRKLLQETKSDDSRPCY